MWMLKFCERMKSMNAEIEGKHKTLTAKYNQKRHRDDNCPAYRAREGSPPPQEALQEG